MGPGGCVPGHGRVLAQAEAPGTRIRAGRGSGRGRVPARGATTDRGIVTGVSQARDDRLPLTTTIVFGLVVICAFGSWLYGYGVLLEPIRAETGWSESLLSSAYKIEMLAM